MQPHIFIMFWVAISGKHSKDEYPEGAEVEVIVKDPSSGDMKTVEAKVLRRAETKKGKYEVYCGCYDKKFEIPHSSIKPPSPSSHGTPMKLTKQDDLQKIARLCKSEVKKTEDLISCREKKIDELQSKMEDLMSTHGVTGDMSEHVAELLKASSELLAAGGAHTLNIKVKTWRTDGGRVVSEKGISEKTEPEIDSNEVGEEKREESEATGSLGDSIPATITASAEELETHSNGSEDEPVRESEAGELKATEEGILEWESAEEVETDHIEFLRQITCLKGENGKLKDDKRELNAKIREMQRKEKEMSGKAKALKERIRELEKESHELDLVVKGLRSELTQRTHQLQEAKKTLERKSHGEKGSKSARVVEKAHEDDFVQAQKKKYEDLAQKQKDKHESELETIKRQMNSQKIDFEAKLHASHLTYEEFRAGNRYLKSEVEELTTTINEINSDFHQNLHYEKEEIAKQVKELQETIRRLTESDMRHKQ